MRQVPLKVFLIGYMGSGKTTRGPHLSAALGMPFLDLDELLENQTGMTIAEWFAERGEDDFRTAEHHLLRTHCISPDSFVMATGGGTPVHRENMSLMNQYGTTVYLHVKETELVQRLQSDRIKRPLLTSCSDEDLDQHIRAHLHAREPRYNECHFIWGVHETAGELAERMDRRVVRGAKQN